jgi:uncharacterized cupredoxin-like copper-binding protein
MWVDDAALTKVAPGGSQARIQPLLVANAFARLAQQAEKGALIEQLNKKTGPRIQELVSALQAKPSAVMEEKLEDLLKTHQLLKLATVPAGLKFDTAVLPAKAGQPVALEFNNPDLMPHNVVVSEPGSLALMQQECLKMLQDPDGQAKAWIPKIPEVIGGTLMVDPNAKTMLKLPALEKGDYVLVCTFPSHPQVMHAVLRVE